MIYFLQMILMPLIRIIHLRCVVCCCSTLFSTSCRLGFQFFFLHFSHNRTIEIVVVTLSLPTKSVFWERKHCMHGQRWSNTTSWNLRTKHGKSSWICAKIHRIIRSHQQTTFGIGLKMLETRWMHWKPVNCQCQLGPYQNKPQHAWNERNSNLNSKLGVHQWLLNYIIHSQTIDSNNKNVVVSSTTNTTNR